MWRNLKIICSLSKYYSYGFLLSSHNLTFRGRMDFPVLLKDPKKRARTLIKKITHSGELELDKECLLELKGICKTSGDDLMVVVYKECMNCLHKGHSQVRVSTVRLIDYLFQKSHVIREKLLDHFDIFLELTLAISQQPKVKLRLPPPKKYAALLQETTAKLINSWHSDYGAGYEKIRYAYRFLREHQLVDFSAFRVRTHEDLIKRQKLLEKQEKILTRTIENRLREFRVIKPEIEQLVAQIESLVDMITITSNSVDLFQNANVVESNLDEGLTIDKAHKQGFGVATLSQTVGIEFSPFIEVKRNDDNKEMLKSLRELKKELVTGKLTKIIGIEKTLTKRSEQFIGVLKEIIELKSKAMNLVLKLGELKLIDDSLSDSATTKATTLDDTESEEESDFEDVAPKEGLETYIPKSMRSEYGLEAIDPKELADTSRVSITDLPSCSSSSSGLAQDSITIACNVKLESGKLCPRQDKIKCPFHGKIIPRDHNGIPLNEQDRLNEEKTMKRSRVPDWQDPELLQDIKRATGIDLTMPKKGRSKTQQEKKLVNVRTCDMTPQQRIQKRLKKLRK